MKRYPKYVNRVSDSAPKDATFNNDIDMVKLLIDNGIDVNTNNSKALMFAVKHGHYNMVKLLLKLGADVHARNNKAFKCSMRDRDPHLLKLLLRFYDGDDKLKEKYTFIANDLEPRKHNLRFAYLHGDIPHKIYPYDDTYQHCDECNGINIITVTEYLKSMQ